MAIRSISIKFDNAEEEKSCLGHYIAVDSVSCTIIRDRSGKPFASKSKDVLESSIHSLDYSQTIIVKVHDLEGNDSIEDEKLIGPSTLNS